MLTLTLLDPMIKDDAPSLYNTWSYKIEDRAHAERVCNMARNTGYIVTLTEVASV